MFHIHKWSKWRLEDVTKRSPINYTPYIATVQLRTCVKCGLTKHRPW